MTPTQASSCCRPIDDLLDPGLFKAMSDPTRVRILGCLAKCGRPCSVSEIAACCSVDLSVVSRHLRALEQAGLLTASKSGRVVSYAVLYRSIGASLRRLADAIDECDPAQARDGARRNSQTRRAAPTGARRDCC